MNETHHSLTLEGAVSVPRGIEPTSQNLEGPGSRFRLGSRSIEHAKQLSSTHSLVLCSAWLVTMALHVHYSLSQFSPLTTSGDDE